MIRSLSRFSCLAFFMALVSLGAVYAQETAALSDEQVKERLTFLGNALQSGQPRAKTWWYGWISAYSAGAVAQAVLAKSHWNDTKIDNGQTVRDRDFAEDMLVGGATLAAGVAGLLIDPFLPAYGPNRLRSMQENTPEERRAKLLKAEELLRQCARREKEGRGWRTHLLNIGVNAAAGIVTVAAFHRPWSDGLVTFATGEAVSLLTIFTQPCRSVRDLNDYEARYLGKHRAHIVEPSNRRWTFGLCPGGVSIRLQF
jgi:hypothetical protein